MAFGALCVVTASSAFLLLSQVPGARHDDSIPDCSTKARNRPRQAFPFLVSDYSLHFQGITCLGAGRGQCPFPSRRLFLFPWVPSFPSLCLHGILKPQALRKWSHCQLLAFALHRHWGELFPIIDWCLAHGAMPFLVGQRHSELHFVCHLTGPAFPFPLPPFMPLPPFLRLRTSRLQAGYLAITSGVWVTC